MNTPKDATVLCALVLAVGCTGQTELFPDQLGNAGSGSVIFGAGTSGAGGTSGNAPAFGMDAGSELGTSGSETVRFNVVSVAASAEGGDTSGFMEDIPGLGSTLIIKDGEILVWGSGGGEGTARGLNIALIDVDSLELVEPAVSFDTFVTRDTHSATAEAVDYLSTVPDGVLVVFTVVDEAGLNFSMYDDVPDNPDVTGCDFFEDAATQDMLAQLTALGATEIQNYCYRDSYALVAIQGAGTALGEALARGQPAMVEFTLPRP